MRVKLFCFFFIFFTGILFMCFADNLKNSTNDAVQIQGTGKGKWIKGVYSMQGVGNKTMKKLPYQLFCPEGIDENKKIPLVIFLHGTGECGTDNEKQMYINTDVGPDFFDKPERQKKFPCFILAPQTIPEVRWANDTLNDYDFYKTPETPAMQLLLSLIDNMKDKSEYSEKIDKHRIYIAGLSRGGQGTWDACMRRPELFAAALPMCGAGSATTAGLIKHMAIWTFHGDNDHTTDVKYTRNMHNALMKHGKAPERIKKTEFQGGEHHNGWEDAFKIPNLEEWLFSWKNNNCK